MIFSRWCINRRISNSGSKAQYKGEPEIMFCRIPTYIYHVQDTICHVLYTIPYTIFASLCVCGLLGPQSLRSCQKLVIVSSFSSFGASR